MTDLAAPFAPDWVSPPGDSILEIIEEREWTQAELAKRLGFSCKHINQLIKGKVPLTEDAALRLERVLGSNMAFWLAREAKYRERCARLAAVEQHTAWAAWLDLLPLKELMAAGAIRKCRIDAAAKPGLVEQCLQFFGVASPDDWRAHYGTMQAAFRRGRVEQSDIGAISAWLRLGEQAVEQLDGPRFDRAGFISALTEIRTLTQLEPADFEPRLRTLFHQAGVAFVLVPAIPKAHVSGVARWLNAHRPLIQLSLYGKTNDKFWFTLFHEAAHILLHSSEKKSVYLDDLRGSRSDAVEEREANDWARDFLIAPEWGAQLSLLRSEQSILDFAQQINIHPGIVVGRLQHDGAILFASALNKLKVSFQFQSMEN